MSIPSIDDMLKGGLQFVNWSATPKAPSYSTKVVGAEWIEVRNFPVPIEVVLQNTVLMTSGPMIMAKMQVSNRDNPGTAIWVQSQFVLGHAGGVVEKVTIGAAVHRVLRDLLLHELDECLYVDGVLAYDPHMYDPLPMKFDFKMKI